jgi:hypothetical protein
VLAWLSRNVVRFPRGTGNPASFWWWCGHAAAGITLFFLTLARGADTWWFWIIGAPIAVSSYVGQHIIQQRAASKGSS